MDRLRQTHIEVLQLGFGRGLVHELQNRAQVTNVDASLVKGFCQCSSIHRQRAMLQTVLNLVIQQTINTLELNSLQ